MHIIWNYLQLISRPHRIRYHYQLSWGCGPIWYTPIIVSSPTAVLSLAIETLTWWTSLADAGWATAAAAAAASFTLSTTSPRRVFFSSALHLDHTAVVWKTLGYDDRIRPDVGIQQTIAILRINTQAEGLAINYIKTHPRSVAAGVSLHNTKQRWQYSAQKRLNVLRSCLVLQNNQQTSSWSITLMVVVGYGILCWCYRYRKLFFSSVVSSLPWDS